jgi:hypothetical protein
MAIRFTCGCGRNLAVKDELAGRAIRCPQCQDVVTVPAGQGAVRATPPPLRSALAELNEDEPELRPSRPSRIRSSDDDEEEEEEENSRPRRSAARDEEPVKKKKKRRIVVDSAPSGDSSRLASIGLGLLMMVGAVAWFVAGLFANRIFIYPPILFVSGVIALVKGLTQSD